MADSKGLAIASTLVWVFAVPGAYLALILLNGRESGTAIALLLVGPPTLALLLSGIAIVPGRERLGARPGDRLGTIAGIVSLLALVIGLVLAVFSNPY
ncbi:MAG TPA: hypothetical protein VFC03_14305 [Acidimicrobiales bacterium]|nr:hypothetical protein [Acidimicrobiales bacterium]